MKKVMNVGIGGRSFILDEDAYHRLDMYLSNFRKKAGMGASTKEVIDELENRIAELLTEALSSRQEVVNLAMIERIVNHLGMPDGSDEFENGTTCNSEYPRVKKFYRDPNHRVLGGVCSGLAAFFNIDTVLVRVIFFVALFMGSVGFWIYVILWVVAPLAHTAAQKCEMYGLPVTAENLRKYSNY
ncbi:MAG: PspC domain-containing protein [Culturomica sp.]|jgi:phage shock protein PspC (stress-responsive transcriptional regulator)|nr:PspC domain-containing protein [Culturomica sp.]